MKVSPDKLKQLMDKQAEGNYNRFARDLHVDPSHLHHFINYGMGGGKKIIFALISYCKDKELNFEDYLESAN